MQTYEEIKPVFDQISRHENQENFLEKKNMKPHQVNSISNIQTMGNATEKIKSHFIYMYIYFTMYVHMLHNCTLVFHVSLLK